MAAAKKEKPLRFFLERYFVEPFAYKFMNKDMKNLFLDFVMQTINEVEEFRETLQKIEKEANQKSRYIQLQVFAKTVIRHVASHDMNKWYSIISNKKDGDSEDRQVNEEEMPEAFNTFNTFTNMLVEPSEGFEDSENSEEPAKKRRRLN